MEDLLIQMGRRIQERRKQLYLTQEKLAEKAGITPQTISSAELGRKALRPENIIGISAALEVSTDYLLLGRITKDDQVFLLKEVSGLQPEQYTHLENIVKSYIAAVHMEGA